MSLNKGHGAGGANTNASGLSFEKISEIPLKNIESSTFSDKVLFEYDNHQFQLQHIKKANLFPFMDSIQKLDKSVECGHGCKQPDECYIEISKKLVFIIEKKNQNRAGSVCEKIQTAPFKLYQYKRHFPQCNVHYIYCLSEWFQDNCKAELKYLTDLNIPYFFYNEGYLDSIKKFIYDKLVQNDVQNDVREYKEITLQTMPTIKPILKWVGGKSQLIDVISTDIPNKIQGDYIEPFVGGGAVLLYVLQNCSVTGQIIASDSNPGLISMYKNIQSDCKEVSRLLDEYSQKYSNFPTTEKTERRDKSSRVPEDEASCESQGDYYYLLRNRFNELLNTNQYDSYEYSALFIFLNKTSFRGVYREGPNGFNVPFGHYKSVNLPNLDELRKFSEHIQKVTFKCQDFQEALQDLKNEDFTYVDPPYCPETTTSFVNYTRGGFKRHDELFNVLLNTKANFLMSNANVDLIHKTFVERYHIKTVEAKRHINSKNPAARCEELLISKKMMSS